MSRTTKTSKMIVLACIALTAASCCCEKKPTTLPSAQTSNSADSADAANILLAWSTQVAAIPRDSKTYPSSVVQTLTANAETLSDAQLTSVLAQIPSSTDIELSYFQSAVIEALLRTYLQRSDQPAIINLLAYRYEDGLTRPTEWILANSDLKNPVRILIDAYNKSASTGNRAKIMAAVYCAFPNGELDPIFSYRRETDSALTFATKCADWIDQNQGRLSLNPLYRAQNAPSVQRPDAPTSLYLIR